MGPKLDVGGTLREVFDIYRNQAAVLLPVAFWLFLVVAIVNGLTAESFSLYWLSVVVSVIVLTLYEGMIVGLVSDIQDGRRDSSVGELMRSVLPVLAPLVGAGLVAGVGIGIGAALLVVPGLYLMTIWAVVAPVIVVERLGVFDALGRSRALVRGSGWQVFWSVLIANVITIAVALVLARIAAEVADGPLVRIVFSAIASTVTAPITGLVAAVLYFRLRGLRAGLPPAVGSVPQ